MEGYVLKVLATTFDVASVSRQLIKIQGLASSEMVYKVQNPRAWEETYLYSTPHEDNEKLLG